MSVLDYLNVHYIIEDVPGDGDCFYHAVSKQLKCLIDSVSLRRIVSDNLNLDDLYMYNALNNTNLSLRKLKHILKKPCGVWADSIEISVLTRVISGLCIIIFDDEYLTIHKICNDNNEKKINVFLRRRNFHYDSVVLRNEKKILKVMIDREVYSILNHHNVCQLKLLTYISCVLPIVFVVTHIICSK